MSALSGKPPRQLQVSCLLFMLHAFKGRPHIHHPRTVPVLVDTLQANVHTYTYMQNDSNRIDANQPAAYKAIHSRWHAFLHMLAGICNNKQICIRSKTHQCILPTDLHMHSACMHT